MEELQNPISRRRMLKRIGAGAAIAWSAPVLSSLRTPAFAQPYPARCRPEDAVDCAGGTFVICGEPVCACVRSVEGDAICGADPCGPPCSTTAECEALSPGSICQAPGTGCCGQVCIAACGSAFQAGEGSNVPR
jgi:hypothetical protein